MWKAQLVRGMKHAPILFQQHRRVTMRVPVTEDQFRTLAFYLWQADGSPDGWSDEFWKMPASAGVTAARCPLLPSHCHSIRSR
jgi:Protein of unknown function (DUF2934)